MILSAIAAMARNRVIGVDNKLPWDIPEEMAHFRKTTKGKLVIMGRKTFESLGGQPLPGRIHIVITRQNNYIFNHPKVHIVSSLEQAIAMARTLVDAGQPEEVFVLGGAEIYKQSLPFLDRLYLSVIDMDAKGDAHFPHFEDTRLKLTSSTEHSSKPPFRMDLYERK